jgi:putative sterol carrier protein
MASEYDLGANAWDGPLFKPIKMKVKKNRATKIHEAFEALQKALREDEPHIRIMVDEGIDKDSEQGKVLLKSLKVFIDEYKKYYGMKTIEVELVF